MDLSAYFASLNLLNLLSRMPAAVAQGLIWGLMALGVFVTFRLLDIADLTVDGSFATGGAVTVMLLLAGWPAWAALLAAILAGVLTGLCTGWLHTKLGIPAILAGILTQFSLYSINLRIMAGKANQTASIKKFGMFWDAESGGRGLLVSSLHIPQAIAVGAVLAALVIGLFYWYFGTEQGSALRATGSNPAHEPRTGHPHRDDEGDRPRPVQWHGRAGGRTYDAVSGHGGREHGPRRHRHWPCRHHYRRGAL